MLKLNVGVARKVGEASYGSRGASVNLELEVESGLAADTDALRDRVRHLFCMARAAVEEELSQNQSTPTSQSDGAVSGPQRGNGHRANGKGIRQTASHKQLDYVRQLARQINGLGVRRLDSLAEKMFGKPVAGLGSLEASGLIDTLKSIKSGQIDIDAALNGVTT